MSSTVLGRNAVTVNKKYTEYFLPTVLTAMATNIAMIVDSIIAGNLLGQNSLAAINSRKKKLVPKWRFTSETGTHAADRKSTRLNSSHRL